ncbi:MAG: hypothetical protein AAFP19_02705 [Bacteroidota bacterium]
MMITSKQQKMKWLRRLNHYGFLIFIMAFSPLSQAQELCYETPGTFLDFAECNRNLARTFAPRIRQWVSQTADKSEDGNADRIVQANYDGDWNTRNNWDHAFLTSDLNDMFPAVYYHVIWTDKHWFIEYTLYWGRDYTKNSTIFCRGGQHEGDADKVILIVARPESPDDVAEDLAVGVSVSRHGHVYFQNCANDLSLVADSDPYIDWGRTHTNIGVAAGTHALFHNPDDAEDEGRRCDPTSTTSILYLPGITPTKAAITDVAHTERYELIDVLSLDDGLWDRRNDPQAFPNGVQFGCDNYNCDPGNVLASAPWRNEVGSDPSYFFTYHGFSLNCECNPNNNVCVGFGDLSEDLYVFNPVLCPTMPLSMTLSDPGVLCNEEIFSIEINNVLPYDNTVTWLLPKGFDLLSTSIDGPHRINVEVGEETPPGTYHFIAIIEDGPCFPKIEGTVTVVQGASIPHPLINTEIIICNDVAATVRFELANENSYPPGTTFLWEFVGASPNTSTATAVYANTLTPTPIEATLSVTSPCGGQKSASTTIYTDECEGDGPLFLSPNPTNGQTCLFVGKLLGEEVNRPVDFSTISPRPISDIDPSTNRLEVFIFRGATMVKSMEMNLSLECVDMSNELDGLYHMVTQYRDHTYEAAFVKQSQ